MLGAKFLIIGSGKTGLHLAKELSGLGESVILVEHDSFGGSYLHNLDIPKFWLKHESKKFQTSMEMFRDYENTHLILVEHRKNIQKIIQDKVLATYQYFLKDYHKTENLQIVAGKASFFSRNLIEISTGQEREFATFEHVILAVGKNTLVKPQLLIDKEINFLHQYNVFQFKTIPTTLAIIGFDSFSLEIADIYSSFGIKVNIFEKKSLVETMPNLNTRAIGYLTKFFSNKQIECHFETEILQIDNVKIDDEDNENNLKSRVKIITNGGDKKENKENIFDAVFLYVKECFGENGLGLNRVGIKFDPKGIQTDTRCRTTMQNVWAMGGCNSKTLESEKNSQLVDFLFKVRQQQSNTKLWDTAGFPNETSKSLCMDLNLSKPMYTLGVSDAMGMNMYKPDFEIEIIQKIDREGFVTISFRPSNGQILGATLVGEMSEYRHYINMAMVHNLNALGVIRYIWGS